ncbi:zinc finger and SCAN domain-containing protein 26-like [Schistocerca nitens]|uniref:zinc finger and SCAN domain-containing protein 26-like n=1 Tax=Schistocerca nitens TaxID=7011 RepID=UPI002117A6BD|nr:zinc finger and SCAN domain-containing protein 26-like [Schistocerca nitens]
MDSKGTSWLKKEKNEVYAEPGSLVQLHTSTIKVKEELDEQVNQQFLQDPPRIVMPSLRIKQDLELKRDLDGIEHDCLEDNSVISRPNDFIKEDPELNLEVAASIRNASDSLSFIQCAGDSCNVSYQEALHQGLVDDDLEIDTEMSTDVSMSHNYTTLRTSQEDSLCCTSLSCSIREKEFHKFNCSFCLQSFPSKYRLIMHIFIHIDGVQAPAYVCKSCGEVLPTDDSLKEHLRMSEGDQALSAANSEKLQCSDDHENKISLESVREEIVEQTEKQSSSKETRKTLRKSFSDICNTHTVTQVAEKLGCDDYGISCTSDHVNVHTVLSAKRHHKCDVSGKLFTRSGNLKTRLVVGTVEVAASIVHGLHDTEWDVMAKVERVDSHPGQQAEVDVRPLRVGQVAGDGYVGRPLQHVAHSCSRTVSAAGWSPVEGHPVDKWGGPGHQPTAAGSQCPR